MAAPPVAGKNDPEQMEEITTSGKADIVEMVRQLLIKPDFHLYRQWSE